MHFFQWVPGVTKYHLRSNSIAEWFVDLGFYLSDLTFVPDIVELFFVWFYPGIRLLNENERKYAKEYFGNRLNLDNIRMNNRIHQRLEKLAVAFVSFNTINFAEIISLPIFIHELVHIWQYQKFGSVYIYRALKAQSSPEGYDYGGLENLYTKMLNNYVFTDFNFEQQGEIFEDYCRLKESENNGNALAQASFEYFVGQVRQDNLA